MDRADNREKAARLREWILQADHTVFFGGAGVSTDSGLADFRSRDRGLYHQDNPYGVPTERILSHGFYKEHPAEFFTFYRTRLLKLEAPPNEVHFALADMERQGRLAAIVTQNADGLHQRAGSRTVIDLHGNVYDNTCELCGRKHPAERTASCAGIPRCECGGIIRPGIVLFDEIPDPENVWEAVRQIRRSDLLLIAGTSLRVSSASRLLQCFRGAHLVILNREETAMDDRADLIIRGSLTGIFRQIWPMDGR